MNKVKIFSMLIVLLFISCKNNKSTNSVNSIQKTDRVKEQQKLMVIGKNIKSLKKIINDSIDLKNKVIFIYNGYDCESCIDVGYDLAKKIDSLSNKQNVYVIATSTNISRDQFRNKYYNFVYIDEHDIIRHELKYVYTPIIIKLDSLSIVKNVFFPNNNRNKEVELSFVRKCIVK